MVGEVKIRDKVRDIVRLPQLRPILDAFHVRLASLSVGIALDGSKLVLGGSKKSDTEIDDVLIQSMLSGKLEAMVDIDLLDQVRAVLGALEEAKKSLFSDNNFVTQLDSLLKQDVDDPAALARLCVNFTSAVSGDRQLARLGEIADPGLIIAMTRATVSLSVSRPAAVAVSVPAPEPVAAPNIDEQMRKVLGLLGIAGAHPVAEEFIRGKLSAGETDLNRIAQLYREAEHEQERQSLARKNVFTKALVELGVDNQYISEMDAYYPDKKQAAADRLAYFRREYGDAITLMIVYKQKTRLLEPNAENLAKEFSRRSEEIVADADVQNRYKDSIDLLITKVGLQAEQCYVIVHALKKESCVPERAKRHLDLLRSKIPDPAIRIILLSSPSTLRLLSRVEDAISDYEADNPKPVGASPVAADPTRGEPAPAASSAARSVPQPASAPTSPDAIAFKASLVRIGIDDARANEICAELNNRKGATKEIERLLQKHAPVHLAYAIYQDPIALVTRLAHVHQEAERCRDAQKIKDNAVAMAKYAGIYKALNDLGILEEHCYVVINTLAAKDHDAALALANLRKLIDNVPASRVKFVLLRMHTALCNDRTLSDAIKRYGNDAVGTASAPTITNPLTRRLVEIGVDRKFAGAFVDKHSESRHAEVLSLVEGHIRKFGAGLVAAVICKDPNFMKPKDRAERVLQEHKDKIEAVKADTAVMEKYKEVIAVLNRKVGLSEEQTLLVVATLRDNKSNAVYTKGLLDLMAARVQKDKLKEALIERPTVLLKRDLTYALLRKYPKQGEQSLDENPLKELEKRLVALGVDSFTRKEILESDRYKTEADSAVIGLMILEMRGKTVALLAVYKARELIIGVREPKDFAAVLKAIEDTKKDSKRLDKYKDLIKALTDELGVPLDGAYHIIASTHVGKDETLVTDLRILIQRVGKEKIKGVLLKAPHALSSRHMTEALLFEHLVAGVDEAQLVKDVIAHAATVHSDTFEGKDPSIFIQNVVHSAFAAYGGCPVDWIWGRVKFYARAMIIQLLPKGVPYEFTVSKIMEGVIDPKEVLAAWEHSKPADASAPGTASSASTTSTSPAGASPGTATPGASPFATDGVGAKLAEYLSGSVLDGVTSAVSGVDNTTILTRIHQLEELVAGSRVPEAQRKDCIAAFLSNPESVFSLVHGSSDEFDSALIEHVANAEG